VEKKRFFIETFGCQMNELDSQKVAGLLSDRGMIPVPALDDAEVILLNTCAIRDKAIQKVYSRLGELKKRKDKRPELVIGVIGCGAQMEGAGFVRKTSVVDLVTGPQKIYAVPAMLERVFSEGIAVVDTDDEASPQPAEIENVLRENKIRAYVTIMEGCDQSCTFCVVPFTRGRAKHRPSDRIIAEVRSLVARGYGEIVLLGQNVNSYHDPSPAGVTFAELLRAVGSLEGVRRVRFTSPHPMYFTDDVVAAISEVPALCNSLHLPVQSGSTKVLARMNREYTRSLYMEKVRAIKSSPREIAISTDIIVGFPGETEEDFADTMALLDEVEYGSIFSFKYSPRPHTAAERFEDVVLEQEKSRRLTALQEKQRGIQERNNKRYLGKVTEVLVENAARARFALAGRTTDNKVVNFDGPAELLGSFVNVRIASASANSLQGELTV
jgi:tRNA-2-methylthio-N6-dimethylallyladenosine synthase